MKRPSQKRPVQPSSALARRAMCSLRQKKVGVLDLARKKVGVLDLARRWEKVGVLRKWVSSFSIKTRASFPSNEAVSKLFYLALNRFTIEFEDRLSPV